MLSEKWKQNFIWLAEHVAGWSKDPSTKVGACIIRPDKSLCSLGFNGFPIGTDDSLERYMDRDFKLKFIRHAEANAITFAEEPVNGYHLFIWPFSPCLICASEIIQNKISFVYAPPMPESAAGRWGIEMDKAIREMRDAGIHFEYL